MLQIDGPTGNRNGSDETGLEEVRQQMGELLDREAIRQLPIAYAHFARIRNVEALVALFAKDAVFDMLGELGAGASPLVGSTAIGEILGAGLARLDPWPFIHNHYIEMLGGDRAEGFVYIELRMGAQKLRVSHVGYYKDEYVKEEGGWKFRSRKLVTIPVPRQESPGID